MEEIKGSLSKPAAVIACIGMTLFYVATLYAPTLILRLPPPHSFNNFMTRRFICAAVSSVAFVIICALLLPIRSGDASYLFGVYGIRSDHIWQAVLLPLFLTSLMYAGSLVLLASKWMEHRNQDRRPLLCCIKTTLLRFPSQMSSVASDVLFWRNLVVVTHLNHMAEIYSRHNYSLREASMVVGLQLGYTVVFGSYASFLFIRTGNLACPLVAHVFCNYMGLPVLFVQRKGLVSVAFVAGTLSFAWLLFPLTRPDLYNERTNSCRCWQGYCLWN
ncbi:hypothetical protein V6N13_035186 [Hibiscus sabdariffa]